MQLEGKVIAFGDLHGSWSALNVILGYAREYGINNALNLGDEAGNCPLDDVSKLYSLLKQFRDEDPQHKLVCVWGDDTGYIPEDLRKNYVGFESLDNSTNSDILCDENLIAAHAGEWIIEKHGDMIRNWQSYHSKRPLVILHGHSHSIGICSKFEWLDRDKIVDFLPNGSILETLENDKVYWINPGIGCGRSGSLLQYANFAVIDRCENQVELHSVPFQRVI